jgi:hypothetical protein
MFLDYFDVLISNMIFKKYIKKYYFDTFSSEKYFENATATILSNLLSREMLFVLRSCYHFCCHLEVLSLFSHIQCIPIKGWVWEGGGDDWFARNLGLESKFF